MSYTALYRKWRPQTFKDVVGQKHVTITLKNQIKNNRIAHAYLLCGTRGTGKTSIAKILSKAVNCLDLKDGEPCNECEICKKINSGTAIDVVEMDAASHRGIDKMRDIIETVQYPPRESRYKVYIIDEVHMLTVEAVNAFLKTLEEPPKNVIFILATTDPQKLPVTILSRCQRFDFKRIKSDDISKRLRMITKDQGVFADDNSINLIARMSDGSMRDALSILDQAMSMGDEKVEYEQIINMLGLVTNENLFKLIDVIIEKDVEKSLKIVDDIVNSGKDVYNFIKDMILHMRNLMIVKVSKNPEEIIDMSIENIQLIKKQSEKIGIEEIMRHIRILQEAEEQSKWSKQSRIYLELAIIKMCKIEYDTSNEIMLSRINQLEKIIKEGNINITPKHVIKKKENNKKKANKDINNNSDEIALEQVKEDKDIEKEQIIQSKLTLDDVKKSWKDILEIFKARRIMTVYAYLITGKPIDCKNGVVEIRFGKDYAFSKKNLQKEENNKIVKEIFSEALKEKVDIKYSVEKDNVKEDKDPEKILKDTFGEDMVEIIDQ